VSYTNNSIVNITEIGTGNAALFCTTTLPQCCLSGHGGGWFLPNGTEVMTSEKLQYYRNRTQNPGTLLLHHKPEGNTTGIFRCDIPGADDVTQSLFVGIYTSTTGEYFTLGGWLVTCREICTPAKDNIYFKSLCIPSTLYNLCINNTTPLSWTTIRLMSLALHSWSYDDVLCYAVCANLQSMHNYMFVFFTALKRIEYHSS